MAIIPLINEITEFNENDKIAQNQNHLDITHLRLPFIENQGQIPSEYKYYAKTFAGTVYVTNSDLTYQSIKNENNSSQTLVIKEKFLGNSLHPQGNEKSESVVNYFKGTQDNWKTGIPTYNYVSLGQIWNNVDVDLKAHGNNMEKIFTIHPGGNPSNIQMSFDGISSIGISEHELKIDTALGEIFLSKPIGYQVIDGKKYDVPISYDVLDSTTYGFSVEKYDVHYDLAIDPLIASTFIGGNDADFGYAMAIDSSGNVYVTGETYDGSVDIPTTAGAYDTTQNGNHDVFVSKFNSALTTLSASTFIGGSDIDTGESIAIDSSGNVYVTGEAYDAVVTDFPTTAGAYDQTYNTVGDVFITRITGDLASSYSSTLSESLGISASVSATRVTVTSTNVTSGVSVTKTLPTAGTLEVTLPSTSKVSFTLPSGISGDVTVVTTNSGSSAASISFLGTVVDFSTTASCAAGCPVAFNFTQAELTASGFSRSQIKVFHDSSGDGSFQTSEALTTTITTFSGGFTATASTPSTSKFAIGGVAGSVTANAAAGIGAAGSFLGLLKDNCDESGFGNGDSLRIYEISYDKCDANQITILADTTCGPMNVRVEKESSMNLAGMPSDQPYLHDEKRMIVLSSPITSDVMDFSIIAKDKRDEFYEKIDAEQYTGTKQYTFATGYTSEQNNAASPLLPEWIKNNAKWWSSGEIDDDTFVNGIQYLVKHNVITVEKNTPTENTDDTIPEWIKNNAKWWSSGEIDDQTFVNGIQYLVKVGSIKVN